LPAPALRYGLAFLAGVYSILLLPRLPAGGSLLVAALVVVLLVRRWPLVACGLAGLIAVCVDVGGRLADRLDPSLVGEDVQVQVRIVDFPQYGKVMRLLVAPVDRPELPARLRLSWYDAEAKPLLGECWILTGRLRRPRGFANPGRFDYEAWLTRKRVGATGYVREAVVAPECPAPGALVRTRRDFAARIQHTLPADDATAVILAIVLGARQWLGDDRWQAFAVTGSSHLMAISGMHVALASGAFYLLLRCSIGALSPRLNQRNLAAGASLLLAGGYAALSGFAVPSLRALLMLAISVAVVVSRRRIASWQLLGVTLLLVTVQSPFDALSAGFALSFGAVALLMLLAARRRRQVAGRIITLPRLFDAVRQLGILQITLLIGLLPLTVGLFGRLSWVSPLTNLLVLPLFNLLALPAALAGVVLPGAVGEFLLLCAWRVIHWILRIVDLLAVIPGADRVLPGLTHGSLIVAAVALIAALLPTGWPGRRIAWLALLAIIWRAPQVPPTGCVDIDVLDVGQGLAVVVRTRSRTLVYDTGPSFRSGGNTGELVVVPYLQYLGIRQVDLLVVSHADLDHSGGVQAIESALAVKARLIGEPLRSASRASTPSFQCAAGQAWSWDDVGFSVLHPSADAARQGNNASCVLEVRAGASRALLSGDIERIAERQLLRVELLDPVDLVIVPHHGSKTSSHDNFVTQVSPKIAVVSAGFGNRWGMPKPEVTARWRSVGAGVVNTAHSGALGFRLCAEGGLTERFQQRKDRLKVWHEL